MTSIKFTIVYDNEIFTEGMESAWGFSCLIETASDNILFDTGWDGFRLNNNLKRLKIDINCINKVVLSHSHWDHIGGLPYLLSLKDDMDVYVLTSFSKHLKIEISKRANMHEVHESTKINEQCMSTGELGDSIIEQSLLVQSSKGLIVVTGCSHPGLENILQVASKVGSVFGVLGGFHGFNKFDELKDLSLIVPCHCTEYITKLGKLYPDTVEACGVGRIIVI